MRLQQVRPASRLLSIGKHMELTEHWAIDRQVGDAGSDTRVSLLRRMEDLFATEEFATYLAQGNYLPPVDEPVMGLLASLGTRRFILVLNHLDRLSSQYVRHLMDVVARRAADDITAHIISSRLRALKSACELDAFFSHQSVALVQATFTALEDAQ